MNEQLNKKSHLPLWIIVLFIITGVIIVGLVSYKSYKYFISGKNEPLEDENENTIKCEENWLSYNHDVLGIKFCYPSEWGVPNTSPIKNITRISNMKETFEIQNIYYENALNINFEENSQVRLRLFNDQYSGKSQRQWNEPHVYYESGTTDDVVSLRSGGSICDYRIEYDYRYNYEMELNTFKTIYSDCVNEVKVTLTQNKQFFDFNNIGTLYTYDLRLLSFKKLTNDYFDNVLVSRVVDRANQIQEEIETLDGFFNDNKTTKVENGVPIKTEEQFNQERKEFEQFIKTIIAFKQIPKTQSEFEQISDEDQNITTIRKYYWLIASEKLDEAYNLRADKDKVNYSEFKDWYKNIYGAISYDFEKISDNTYEFYVKYQDHNTAEQKFRVTMLVNENKLTTLSSDEILTEQIKSGDYSAYSIKRGDKNLMILEKNGEENIIDEGYADYKTGGANIGELKIFRNLRFSPNGNYLTYSMFGWEWHVAYVYDIKNKKIVLDSSGLFDFTPNEKYIYTCSSAGMVSWTSGLVYSVTDFETPFYDILNTPENSEYFSVSCEYDQDNKTIIFILDEFYQGEKSRPKKRIEYWPKEGRVEVTEIQKTAL